MKYEVFGNRKQDELNLYLCARDVNIKPGTRYGPVIRDSYIIECCTEGRGTVIINGTEFELTAGRCIILLPGDVVTHTTDIIESRSGVWCAVKGMKIGSHLRAAGISSDNPFAPDGAYNGILREIERMLSMKQDCDEGADLRRSGCMHTLFGELLRSVPSTADSDLYIHRAVGIMEMRCSEKLKIGQIATELGLERCYFSTLFRQKTGVTPYAYLTELRIKKACAMLDNPDYTVYQAAGAAGIEPENFTRLFKSKTGITPLQYRKSKWKLQDTEIHDKRGKDDRDH